MQSACPPYQHSLSLKFIGECIFYLIVVNVVVVVVVVVVVGVGAVYVTYCISQMSENIVYFVVQKKNKNKSASDFNE